MSQQFHTGEVSDQQPYGVGFEAVEFAKKCRSTEPLPFKPHGAKDGSHTRKEDSNGHALWSSSRNNKQQRAGLLVVSEDGHVVTLLAHKPYRGCLMKKRAFLERVSIPRGNKEDGDGCEIVTALREFIEETGRYFENLIVCKRPFRLLFKDPSVARVFEYSIYVGRFKGPLTNVPKYPSTRFITKISNSSKTSYVIKFTSSFQNYEERRSTLIIPWLSYKDYMIQHQLCTYEYSNYIDFFKFVDEIIIETSFYNECDDYSTLSLINEVNERKMGERKVNVSKLNKELGKMIRDVKIDGLRRVPEGKLLPITTICSNMSLERKGQLFIPPWDSTVYKLCGIKSINNELYGFDQRIIYCINNKILNFN
jgi:hypothetical protein